MLCTICNKEFEKQHFNQKYCSDICKKQAMKISKANYKKSDKGKEANEKYLKGEASKEREKRYRTSEKGMELARKLAKRYYDKNKDNEEFMKHKRKIDSKYVQNNYEHVRERNRIAGSIYRKTDKGKATNTKQKFIRRGLTPITQETILKLREQKHCYYCGKEITGKKTIDHKTPVTRGGTNDKENLCIACVRCNSQKHDKTEKEYKEWLLEYENKM